MYPQHAPLPAQPEMHYENGTADMGRPEYAVYPQEHFSGNANMNSQGGFSPPNVASPLMNEYQHLKVNLQSMSVHECLLDSPRLHSSDKIISINPLRPSARNSGELRQGLAEVGKLSTREVRMSGSKQSPYMSPRNGGLNHLQHLAHLQTSFRTNSAKIGRGSGHLSGEARNSGKNTNSQALVNNYSKEVHPKYSEPSSNNDNEEALEIDSSPSEKGGVQGRAMTTVAKDDKPRKKLSAHRKTKTRKYSLFGNLTADLEQLSQKKLTQSANKEHRPDPEAEIPEEDMPGLSSARNLYQYLACEGSGSSKKIEGGDRNNLEFNEKMNCDGDDLGDGFDFHAPEAQRRKSIKKMSGSQKGPGCFRIGGIFDRETPEHEQEKKDKKDIVSDSSSSCSSDEEADYGNIVPRGGRRHTEWFLPNQDLPQQGLGTPLRIGSKTGTGTLGTNTTISSNDVKSNGVKTGTPKSNVVQKRAMKRVS